MSTNNKHNPLPAKKLPRKEAINPKSKQQEEKLDKKLKDTFPASDSTAQY